jgi:hypothetical protein
MTYSGAIKSNIYGLYLRFVNPHFTLTSWRLFGIAFLALGIFSFYLVVGNSISTWTAVVFGMMFLTDASVVLLSRHDAGPVTLALCSKLFVIALWMSVVFRGPSRWKYVLIGFVVGISIFEKLSSAVMVVRFSYSWWHAANTFGGRGFSLPWDSWQAFCRCS